MGRVNAIDSIAALVAGLTGIEVHGNKMRLCFSYKGHRCREVLDIPLTKANVKFAANKLAAIKHEIALGSFDYAKHFPNSKALPRLGMRATTRMTLAEASGAFVESAGSTVGISTKRSYRSAFQRMTLFLGEDMPIADLLPMHVERLRNHLLADCRPRTVRTYLGHVGNLLNWAARNELLERKFDVRVAAARLNPEKSADPFEYWEFQKLIEVTTNRQFKNILLVLAYTGIRPGELRALSWNDIDFENRILHVRRNLTQQKMQFKLPKTNRTRTVHLMPPALNALEDQYKITGALLDAEIDMHLPGGMIVRQTLRPVFRPTRVVPDRPPFYSGVFLVEPWRAAIKKSGVRYRRAYQLRHTYASWNITAHGNLAFIAEQMGHNSAKMLQEVYGKWIESASRSEVDSIWNSMQKNGHLPQ
ncbi:site-specific integrase [Aeromonas dhakensis]|uniref:site-specific integrase n=1 Tax=Aeromonas dhakensis TaxID=196024 RepID=UPI001F6112B6|nr:site-specific integrase [Aeromonas dhakensis]UNU87566.1 site-specific integrase [Aeromonas dhakensis]